MSPTCLQEPLQVFKDSRGGSASRLWGLLPGYTAQHSLALYWICLRSSSAEGGGGNHGTYLLRLPQTF